MKSLKIILLLVITSLCAQIGLSQESKEDIQKELRFGSSSADNQLIVYNVYGSIEVEGYSGNTIQVEAQKIVSASSNQKLEKGKEEVQVKFAEKGDKVYVYMESPRNLFDLTKGKYKDHMYKKGEYTKPGYRFKVHFKIKVPQTSNLKLLAINNGDILVENVLAKNLNIRNINGAITLNNVAGDTYVNALNKDINISYAKNPTGNSEFHSLNGDINIQVQDKLDVDVSFKSMNGDFYTNFETKTLPQKISKTEAKGSSGTKYKLSKDELFRVGNGGVKWHFDLMNGDVMLKK